MELRYRLLNLPNPSDGWEHLFKEFWPAYKQWYARNGLDARPGFDECRIALRRNMPELLPLWEDLLNLAGNDALAGRMLSLYRPPAYLFGCSQAAWVRDGQESFLIRNYDYSPKLCEGVILCSQWNGTTVMGMSDCLWGLVDGVNEHGIALSLTFGGRREVAEGFGIPLILRYALQLATTLQEAVEILERTPSHMAYNVLILDAEGRNRLVYLAPGEKAIVTDEKVSTNHQQVIDWPEYAERTQTVERRDFLVERLANAKETPETFARLFAEEPLHHTGYEKSFGTVYTAIYHPETREAEYRWKGFRSIQRLGDFQEGEAVMLYGDRDQSADASAPWQGDTDWRQYAERAPDQWQWYLPEFLRRTSAIGSR